MDKGRFSFQEGPVGRKENPHASVGEPVARSMGVQVSVRPGKAGLKGMGESDGPMKFSSSSSGCETRPARVQPHRVGSEPCAVRRCVGTRIRGPWLEQPRNAYVLGCPGCWYA